MRRSIAVAILLLAGLLTGCSQDPAPQGNAPSALRPGSDITQVPQCGMLDVPAVSQRTGLTVPQMVGAYEFKPDVRCVVYYNDGAFLDSPSAAPRLIMTVANLSERSKNLCVPPVGYSAEEFHSTQKELPGVRGYEMTTLESNGVVHFRKFVVGICTDNYVVMLDLMLAPDDTRWSRADNDAFLTAAATRMLAFK